MVGFADIGEVLVIGLAEREETFEGSAGAWSCMALGADEVPRCKGRWRVVPDDGCCCLNDVLLLFKHEHSRPRSYVRHLCGPTGEQYRIFRRQCRLPAPAQTGGVKSDGENQIK